MAESVCGTLTNNNNHVNNGVNNVSAKRLMTSWHWGKPPDSDQLESCLKTLLNEQRNLTLEAAESTLFAKRLQRRILVLKRHIIAVKRQKASTAKKPKSPVEIAASTPIENHRVKIIKANFPASSDRAKSGLAKIGSRAALSFAFAFLRRAWRSGEDSDLCSDLLEDSLDALYSLEPGSLFGAYFEPADTQVSNICNLKTLCSKIRLLTI